MSVGGAKLDISVVLGKAEIKVRDLLKMGRGAIITLDALQQDEVWIYAAGKAVGRGSIVIQGEAIQILVTDMLDEYGEPIHAVEFVRSTQSRWEKID